jgi:predicted PurR-regulated permease PerM
VVSRKICRAIYVLINTINPVAVMLSLIFWYWMWGVAGAILAVPMLAIFKILCDRLGSFRAIGHLLEG